MISSLKKKTLLNINTISISASKCVYSKKSVLKTRDQHKPPLVGREDEEFDAKEWFNTLNKTAPDCDRQVTSEVSRMSHGQRRELAELLWRKHSAEFSSNSMPKYLSEEHLSALEKCESKSNMISRLSFLAKQDYYSEKRSSIVRSGETNPDAMKLKAAAAHSSQMILRRMGKADFKFFYRHRLLSSIVTDAPRVVFDFQFMPLHSNDEAFTSLYRHIFSSIRHNRQIAHTPFQIHFCNYTNSSRFHRLYAKHLNLDSNLVFETSQCFTELFPRDRLVYLSPDSGRRMSKFDPDKVYIIGSVYDKFDSDRFKFLTLNKAHEEGIACEKLPVDVFRRTDKTQAINKNMHIFNVFKILSYMHAGLSLSESFKLSVSRILIDDHEEID